jgi:hypothetical protein
VYLNFKSTEYEDVFTQSIHINATYILFAKIYILYQCNIDVNNKSQIKYMLVLLNLYIKCGLGLKRG